MAGVGLRDTGRARLLRREATPAERRLWRYISRSALGAKFSRQMPVGPYFADFLCRELSLVVELDGYSHGFRLNYDAARDRWMAEQGYRVLRFSNEAVFGQLDGVLTVIRMEIEALRSRPLRPARR
ncbi:endonuclease domain-containing protein [Novosphingobium sp. 11B]